MSDTVSLEWIGQTLRSIQAEQRNLKTANELLRKQIERLVTRDELADQLTALLGRMAETESLMERRFDAMAVRVSGRPNERPGRKLVAAASFRT